MGSASANDLSAQPPIACFNGVWNRGRRTPVLALEGTSTTKVAREPGASNGFAPDARPAEPPALRLPAVGFRRIAYFVSRFPVTTETFIVREMADIVKRPGMRVDLYSLFPPPRGAVHRAALPWMRRVRSASPARMLAGLAWCTLRHPLRMLMATLLVCLDYRRRPRLLARALIGLAAAAAHVRAVSRRGTDHVHSHFATYPALAAWLCHRLLGLPYSFTAHAHDLYVHQLGLRRRIHEAEFVIAISDYNRRLVEALGDAGTPVHVVH